ncbi:hypothetical protein GPA19_16035 [Azoarcus indigens]|uniref:DUF4124 domain-containing protein n=1 Tax=Azoarcus indigens TaxID=29545 RepID=A0A4R6DQU7_9RHOO|nr:hypothetical protein [Azoarcus indigens]NMG66455.1 hypothetical protein [Azoarcus indigens]TDN47376.1 hypothetical protein C7389_12043 [Azoarcus indigens]
MGLRRLADIGLAVLLAAPLAASAQSGGGKSIYCCDIGAQPVCGDVLPNACYGRAYREMSPQGVIRRQVAAPLTAEEISRRNEEARARAEAEARLARQRRLDQALLDTYQSVADVESRRDRALADLDKTIAGLRLREGELVERRNRIAKEVEPYQGKSVPRELADDLDNANGELSAHRSVIDAKQRERESIRARFEEDRRRYIDLTTGAPRR